MLSSVLNSKRAIQVNIIIMTTFVQMRELAGKNKDILQKIETLERKYEGHDKQLQEVFKVMRDLVTKPNPKRRVIGIKDVKEDKTHLNKFLHQRRQGASAQQPLPLHNETPALENPVYSHGTG